MGDRRLAESAAASPTHGSAEEAAAQVGRGQGLLGILVSATSRTLSSRDLLGSFATTGCATLAVGILGGLGGVVSSRALGPYERGLLATAMAWSSVLASLAAAGVPQATTFYVARGERAGVYTSSSLVLLGAASVCIATAGIAAAILIGGPAEAALIIVFAGSIPSLVGGGAIGAVLGKADYRRWGALRVLGPAVSLTGIVAVVAAGWRTASAVAAAIVVSWAVSVLAALAHLGRRGLLAAPELSAVQALLSYGWRNVIAGAAWLVSYKLDQIVLTIAVAPAMLGAYAVAASFGEVMVPVAAAVGSVMLARVSQGGLQEVSRSLPAALIVCIMVAGAVAAVTFVAAPFLVRILFGTRFLVGVTALRILLPGAVALAASTVLADMLRGLGDPLVAARAEFAGLTCTAVLLAALLPPLGIVGAAIASTASYTLVATCMGLLLKREFRRRRRTGRLRPSDHDALPRVDYR